MFANAKSCETKKRDLSSDDLGGLCSVYPAFGPIVTCSPSLSGYDATGITSFRDQCARYTSSQEVEGCDCSTLHAHRASKLVNVGLILLMVAGLLLRRQRFDV